MAWKPKEKELSPEEALSQAKLELEPFWFGSDPLLVGIRDEEDGHVNALPLDPKFGKKDWLIFFIDPSDFSGETALHYSREWFKRYNAHELNQLMIFIPPYPYFKKRELIHNLREKAQITFPMVLDAEGLLSQAFGVTALPKTILLSKGNRIVESFGPQWLKQTEEGIQTYLRQLDPGLPLLPIYQSIKNLSVDVDRWELGLGAKSGTPVKFPAQGFKDTGKGFSVGMFAGDRPAALKSGEIFLSGNWIRDHDRIATSDPKAVLGFRCPTPRLALVAESHSKKVDPPKILVELNGVPAFDAVAGEHLIMTDDGQSILKPGGPQLYHILNKLPEQYREVTFRFVNADIAPSAIYGFRLGS